MGGGTLVKHLGDAWGHSWRVNMECHMWALTLEAMTHAGLSHAVIQMVVTGGGTAGSQGAACAGEGGGHQAGQGQNGPATQG